MTDDDCGCKCRECREQDQHRCGSADCGYTKYLRMTTPEEKPAPAVAAGIPELKGVRLQFNAIRNEEAKARLREWTRFCFETAGLEHEIRDAKRRERYAEIFGIEPGHLTEAVQEIDRLKAENAKLRADLNYYQVEAVARTGTDARAKP